VKEQSRHTGRKLSVLGAGCWGTTLAALEAGNFDTVSLFTPEVGACEEVARYHTNEAYTADLRLPNNVFATTRLERAVDGAGLLLVAVPSGALRDVAESVMCLFGERIPTVIATKGLERNTGLTGFEVWRQVTGRGRRQARPPMVLSGPNLASEIARGEPAVSLLAGLHRSEVDRIAGLLEHPRLRLVPYHDPLGAQLAGSLKNVYAVACGLAAGLGWGDNVRAALIWKGLDETAAFAAALGADPAVVTTPAGVGDFVATCTSRLSRNHDLGLALAASTGRAEVTGVREGAGTAGEAARRARSLGLRLRLLEAVWSVMAGAAGPPALRAAVFEPSDAVPLRERAGHAAPVPAPAC